MRFFALVLVLSAGCVRHLDRYASGGQVSLQPSFATVAPGETLQLRSSGGTSFLRYTFENGMAASGPGASVDEAGLYTAGAIGNAEDHVVVSDDAGSNALARIQTTAALSLAVTSTTVAPNEKRIIAVGGGKPPYSFALQDAPSGATIEPITGLYSAGALGNVKDIVRVTDKNAQVVDVTLTVGAPLVLSLERPVALGEPNRLLVTGGARPYFYAFAELGNHSRGTIDAATGSYLPGLNARTHDTVQVTDATGTALVLPVDLGNFSLPTPFVYGPCAASDFDGNGLSEATITHNSGVGFHMNWLDETGVKAREVGAGAHVVDAGVRYALAIQDFDGDGKTDAMVRDSSGVSVLYGDPSMSFSRRAVLIPDDNSGGGFDTGFATNVIGETVAIAVSVKGPDDICKTACTNNDNYRIALLTFDMSVTAVPNAPLSCTCLDTSAPLHVQVGDWDDDTKPDIAYTTTGSKQVFFLVGAGPIENTGPSSLLTFAGPVRAIETFAQNGHDELAVIFQTDAIDETHASLQLVNNFFTTGTPLPAGNATFTGALAFRSGADPTHLLTWDGLSGVVPAFKIGVSGLTDDPSIRIPNTELQTDCVIAADMDGDTVSDLAVFSGTQQSGRLFLGEGGGAFAERAHYRQSGLANSATLDINRDGADDLIGLDAGDSLAMWFSKDRELAYGSSRFFAHAPGESVAGPLAPSGEPGLLMIESSGAFAVYPVASDGTIAAGIPVAVSAQPTFAGRLVSAHLGGGAIGGDFFTADRVFEGVSSIVLSSLLREDATHIRAHALQAVASADASHFAIGVVPGTSGIDEPVIVYVSETALTLAVRRFKVNDASVPTFDVGDAFVIDQLTQVGGTPTIRSLGTFGNVAYFAATAQKASDPSQGYVLISVGQDSATPHVQYVPTGSYMVEALMLDTNADTYPELFVVGNSGRVRIYAGDPSMSYATELQTAPSEQLFTRAKFLRPLKMSATDTVILASQSSFTTILTRDAQGIWR